MITVVHLESVKIYSVEKWSWILTVSAGIWMLKFGVGDPYFSW